MESLACIWFFFHLMMHLLLAEGEATMVQLIAASLETAAMSLNKMRMKISAIGINAPIYLALYPNTFNVTKSNVDGVITYPALKLEGKKLMTVNK